MKHQASLDETIIPAVLSVIGSGTIILTYICFRDLRRLRYIELVFYVAVNSLIAAIGACMGNVSHNAAACYFQDVTTSANNVSAAFWTTVIAYQLWVATVTKGQTLKDLRVFHIVCWLLPWVLVFLPLTTNTFGIPDKGGTWCFIDNRRGSPKWGIVFWEMVSVFIPIAISILIMTALLISVAVQIKTNTLSELMTVALKKLYLYPVVFMVCWIPSVVTDIAIANNSDKGISAVLRGFGNVMPVLQGFLIAVVFFSHNTIVRDHWMFMFRYQVFAKFFCCRSQGASDSHWSQNEPDIKVMMSAEKESDYIDDETRNAFAFRVSFSSAGTSSGDIRSSTFSNYTSTNPLGSPDTLSVNSPERDVYMMSSSMNSGSAGVYVPGSSQSSSRNTLQTTMSPYGMDSAPKLGSGGRGMLSSTPKMSFLYNPSPTPVVVQLNPTTSIQDQNARNLASSAPEEGPMSTSYNRAIQMSSTSTASSIARVLAKDAEVAAVDAEDPGQFGVSSTGAEK